MNTYTVHITLLRDGIARRHELQADSVEQARDLAEDYAVCMYPIQSLSIAVWCAA
jgi:hypothetical protein